MWKLEENIVTVYVTLMRVGSKTALMTAELLLLHIQYE